MAKNKKDILDRLTGVQGLLFPFNNLSAQIQTEYTLAWKHQKAKKDEWEVRLKLYNNQLRDKKAVGDTTLFTIHQTILASLYVDRLDAIWGGKEQGDEEATDNLQALAENDYKEMEMDIIDYDWDWDTCFFGRGLLEFSEFERNPDQNIFIPLPHVLDPITFLRDPRTVSINGDRKARGSARFFGYEIQMTKDQMEDHPHIFSDVDYKTLKYGMGTFSLLKDAIEARNQAQGRQTTINNEQEEKLGFNAEYTLLKWFTHYEIDGQIKKAIVWSGSDGKKVVGLQVLEDTQTKKKRDYWPIIDRPLYPSSHDFDGTSIPDLVEDKQRARALAQNLGLNLMKADLYPMYIYDTNKITNKNDLNFNFNKFIPIDAKGEPVSSALVPLLKARPNLQLLDFVYQSLDASAQKATATPELQQGIMSQEKRTLGEVNLIASKVDTRYSLSAKVFGWSEKRKWRYWYWLYKENFKEDIDEKVLRLEGAFGTKWRPLKKDNFITRIDPDIDIESRVLARAKELEERQSLTQYFGLALQEPTANRRWGLKKLARLNGLKKDEIDRLFPMTVDERVAEDENDLLNENKFAEVRREDDHNVHLEIHAKANDTPSAKAHIETHKKALLLMKLTPNLFPQQPQSANFQPPGTAPLTLPNLPPKTQPAQPMKPMGATP